MAKNPICGAPETFTKENHTLTNLSSLGAVLTLGIAPAVYFWKKSKDEQNNRNRASRNVRVELIDALESLDRKKFKDDACSFLPNDQDKELFFMARKFNHDFYDSLIFSGHITFLEPELQQHLQDIFNRLKTHNSYLDLCRTMQENQEDDTIPPEKTYKYYRWMEKTEIELEKDIPNMIKKLESTINTNNGK